MSLLFHTVIIALVVSLATADVWLGCYADERPGINENACTCCNNGASSEHDAYCWVYNVEEYQGLPPWFEFFSFGTDMGACLNYCNTVTDGYYCNLCYTSSPNSCFLDAETKAKAKLPLHEHLKDRRATVGGEFRGGISPETREEAWGCVAENSNPASVCPTSVGAAVTDLVLVSRANASQLVQTACMSPSDGKCSSYNEEHGICCQTAVGQCGAKGGDPAQVTQKCGSQEPGTCSGAILSHSFTQCYDWFQ